MSGDKTAVLVITKDKTKKGKDCFKDQFHLTSKSGRKEAKLANHQRVKKLVENFAKTPATDFISLVAAELILKD